MRPPAKAPFQRGVGREAAGEFHQAKKLLTVGSPGYPDRARRFPGENTQTERREPPMPDKPKHRHAGHRERVKQEFLARGAEGWPDHRVVELLLFYAIPQGDVNGLAHDLVERFGSLAGVLDASVDELKKVPGVGDHTAFFLHMLPEILGRYQGSRTRRSWVINGPEDAYPWLAPYFFGAKNEKVYVLCLDGKRQVLGVRKVAEGSVQMADGNWVPISQVRQMAQQATDAGIGADDFGSADIYNDPGAGWLGAIGYQGWLSDYDGGVYYPYVPSEAYACFHSRERGGIDQYDVNVAFNVNDRFYLGLTVGLYDVDYDKYAFYDETFDGTGEGYSLETFKRIHGSGFNVKLGAIIRPFEYSPLRVGLAVHTPTFYSLTYATGALLTPDIFLTDESTGGTVLADVVDTYQLLGQRDMERDFRLRTPWLVNASIGYTVGTNLALGAEYEYEDYSAMKFEYPGGEDMAYETAQVKANLKAVHTLRVGAEYRPVPAFALRAGYNYSTAAFERTAINYLPVNALDTDTDFSNAQSVNAFTLGIGYRWPSFYMDLAYKFQTCKSDFYPFLNEMSEDASQDYMVTSANQDVMLVTPGATQVKNTRSQVLLTLGFRF